MNWAEILKFVESARNAEYERCQKIVMEERDSARKEVQRVMDRMSDQIIEKNEQILKEKKAASELILKNKELEMRYEELARQYRELEMKSNKYPGTLGIYYFSFQVLDTVLPVPHISSPALYFSV